MRNVLADRGLTPSEETVDSVAESKDGRYLDLLTKVGPRPSPAAEPLLRDIRERGLSVAVVSASRHAIRVLELAGLLPLVDLVVDGVVADVMHLPGKPDPATFAEAARRLGVEPGSTAVVEDALAGVSAGKSGGFATVVAIDHFGQAEDLRRSGASVVVRELGELEIEGEGPAESPWWLTVDDPDSADEGRTETIFTLANGYVGTRGARPWSDDDGTSYPGTYCAGVYNRLKSQIGARVIETETLVNLPNWLAFDLRAAGGDSLREGAEISSHHLQLDMRSGLLIRRCVVRDDAGRRTALVERRAVSMADPHLLALELTAVALDWSGELEVRLGLDTRVSDDETLEGRMLANRHLEVVDQHADGEGGLDLRVRTVQSQVVVAVAARCEVSGATANPIRRGEVGPSGPEEVLSVDVRAGARVTFEKVVSLYTSRDVAISEPGLAARHLVEEAAGFDAVLASHRRAWSRLWEGVSPVVPTTEWNRLLRLNAFHLLQVASPHLAELDAGLPARGLHGEGYNGHVFWDTLFVLPVLAFRWPSTGLSLLRYRERRLPAARRAAELEGRRGARFPWRSGSDGRDETPGTLYNPRSGRWMPDNSGLQRHVGLAIAYEAWLFWQITGNREFITGEGAELIIEIARYFCDLAVFDPAIGRYRIPGVMGPDEFHDGYPWSEEPGLTDNVYTNVMTSWLLWRALELVEMLESERPATTASRLALDRSELEQWDSVSHGLHVPFHGGMISQFDGYERLGAFDFDAYRARYGDIGRLDLILEAEGDSVNRYQVSKQADVLMLFYLLSAEELGAVLGRLGHAVGPDLIPRTVEYYSARVTHGSTLSKVVHSWVLARGDRHASWRYFLDALRTDIADVARTTREGVHLGAMAGTLDLLRRCYTGLEARGDALWLNPVLPVELDELHFGAHYRGHDLAVDVNHRRLVVASEDGVRGVITLMLAGEPATLSGGQTIELELPV